jgi:hypothetical protein
VTLPVSFDSAGKVYINLGDGINREIKYHLCSVASNHPAFAHSIARETTFVNYEQTFLRWHSEARPAGNFVMLTTAGWTSEIAKRDAGPFSDDNDASHYSECGLLAGAKIGLGETSGGVLQIYLMNSGDLKILNTIKLT